MEIASQLHLLVHFGLDLKIAPKGYSRGGTGKLFLQSVVIRTGRTRFQR